MVEAAELAAILQWMTPEQSRLAHQDAGSKERIGEEVARDSFPGMFPGSWCAV
jgi:hypothetical protein